MMANGVVLLILIHLINITCSSERPSFRIISPQNICKSPRANSSVEQVKGTAISFQPINNVDFRYSVRIFFKLMESESFSQRETLVIWKAVRALEYRINSLDQEEISANNLIFIQNAELISGVKYIFHVVGITEGGEQSKEQIFSLKYSNGIIQNGDVADGLNFLLIGSQNAVASKNYVLYAKVSFCEPRHDYYIQWKIDYVQKKITESPRERSCMLQIPQSSLTAGEQMQIHAQVLDYNSGKKLAEDSIEVDILKKGFEAYIFPPSSKIGIQSNISLQIILVNYDHNDNIKYNWEFYQAGSKVDATTTFSKDNSRCTVSFKNIGRYNVLAYIKVNDVEIKATANIEVILRTKTIFDLQAIPNIIPPSNEDFAFSAKVNQLYTKCKAGWISLQENGYKYIALDELNADNEIEIQSLDEKYLPEIIDLETVYVSRDIQLYVPYNQSNYNRKGLQGDSKYKFRLGVDCPITYEETNSEASVDRIANSNIEMYIHTNAPPNGSVIKVKPKAGYALETTFYFTISEANDSNWDHPLSYELCGLFDGYEICFGKFMEYRHWETMLPFTRTPCKLYIIVCDIRNACNTFYANDVVVDSAPISKQIYQKQIAKMKSALLRGDFADAFMDMSLISITLKNYNSNLLNEFKSFVVNVTRLELDKLENGDVAINHNNIEYVLNLVLSAKVNLNILSIYDENIQQSILSIMDRVKFTDSLPHQSEQSLSFAKAYTEIYLSVIEDTLGITHTLDDGKRHVIDHVQKLCANICNYNSFQTETFETQSISLFVTKCNGADLKKREFLVFNSKLKITLNNQDSWISERKNYCVIIVLYSKDYLTNDGFPIVFVRIYDIQDYISIMEWTSNEKGKEKSKKNIIGVEMHANQTENELCSFWTTQWSQQGIGNSRRNLNTVYCSFDYLGFYRLLSNGNKQHNSIGTTAAQKNSISTKKDSISTIQTTHDFTKLPFTMSPISAETMTSTAIANDNIEPLKSEVFKASTTTYIYVVLLIVIFMIVLIVAILSYYRRKARLKNMLPQEKVLQIRHRRNKIHYGRIHDSHLLT